MDRNHFEIQVIYEKNTKIVIFLKSLPVILVVSFSVSLISQWGLYEDSQLLLEKKMDFLLEKEALELSYPLWIVNEERIRSLSKNLLKDPDIVGIQVFDDEFSMVATEGVTFVEFMEDDKGSDPDLKLFFHFVEIILFNEIPYSVITNSHPIYFDSDGIDVFIGTVHLIISDESVMETLQSVIRSHLLSIILTIFLVSISVIVIYQLEVENPLKNLRRAIGQWGDSDHKYNSDKNENEIDFLSKEFDLLWKEKNALTNQVISSREFYRSTSNNLPIGVLIISSNGQIEQTNKYLSNVFECSESKLLNSNIYDIFPLILNTDEKISINNLELNDHFGPYERAFERKTGEHLIFRVLGLKICIYNTDFILFTLEDISEQFQMREKLQLSSELLDQTSRISHVGGWELEIKNNTLIWSDEVYRIYDVPKDFTLNVEKAIEFYVDDYKFLISEAVDNAIANGRPFELEAEIKTAKDKNKWIIFKGRPYFSNEEIIKITGTVQDITERKNSEETSKILQSELNHKSKIDLLGKLAGGVAHDFNNILGGIMSSADLIKLKLRKHDESLMKYIDIILSLSENAAKLSNKLLVLSRKDKDDQKKSSNIQKMMNETVEIVYNTLNKNIDLKYIEKNNIENLHFIINDSSIQNAIINICINSSHSMPKGGELSITVRRDDLYFYIDISDTGTGMSRDVLSRIFEPFFTTKSEGHGTGLGMVSVKRTIEDHNGEIDVFSTLDVGTTTKIRIPIVYDSQQSMGEDHIVHGSGVILLVDDEEVNREVGKEILESLGYAVILASNGLEAVQIFEEKFREIDITLLDMIMPVLDGYNTFLKMKDIDIQCKFIVSSGYSNRNNIEEMEKMGLSSVIPKPYKIEELSRVISNLIKTY